MPQPCRGLCQLLLVQSVLAEFTEFTASKPQLQAEVSLEADRYWHLGGFCFGHDPRDREVGLLQGRVQWTGEVPLRKANVYLAGFDGREDRWGRAAKSWKSSSCQQKLEEASSYTQLQPGDFTVRILQGTGTRDWHFVLLSCGEVGAGASLKLTLEAERGALSIFEANSQFHSSSCPAVATRGWWLESRSHLGFWTLVLFAVGLGSCLTALLTCCVSRCRRSGAQCDHKSSAGAGASEVVVGRPCEVSHPPGDAIAKGHPHDVKMQV